MSIERTVRQNPNNFSHFVFETIVQDSVRFVNDKGLQVSKNKAFGVLQMFSTSRLGYKYLKMIK
jgi:hypothetical protein